MLPAPAYDRDGITLYHGDCLDLLPHLPRAKAVITDPPYGVNYVSNASAGRGTRPITNDGARLSLYLYRRVLPLLKADHILWFTRWDAWPDVWGLLGQWHPLRGLLVWDKGSPGMGDLNHWGPSYELIASAGIGETRGARDGSVLRYNTVPPARRIHPTEKPVDLLCYLIEKISDPGDLIIDPFAGSGATLEACAKTGRRGIGCEIDPPYIPTIIRRLRECETPLFASVTASERAS